MTAGAEAASRSKRCAVSAASFSFFFLRCKAFLDRPSVLPAGWWPASSCACELAASAVLSLAFFDSIFRRISSISAISRSAAASAALRSAACLSAAALVSAAACCAADAPLAAASASSAAALSFAARFLAFLLIVPWIASATSPFSAAAPLSASALAPCDLVP